MSTAQTPMRTKSERRQQIAERPFASTEAIRDDGPAIRRALAIVRQSDDERPWTRLAEVIGVKREQIWHAERWNVDADGYHFVQLPGGVEVDSPHWKLNAFLGGAM